MWESLLLLRLPLRPDVAELVAVWPNLSLLRDLKAIVYLGQRKATELKRKEAKHPSILL